MTPVPRRPSVLTCLIDLGIRIRFYNVDAII
jgi:hypothetical protein